MHNRMCGEAVIMQKKKKKITVYMSSQRVTNKFPLPIFQSKAFPHFKSTPQNICLGFRSHTLTRRHTLRLTKTFICIPTDNSHIGL